MINVQRVRNDKTMITKSVDHMSRRKILLMVTATTYKCCRNANHDNENNGNTDDDNDK